MAEEKNTRDIEDRPLNTVLSDPFPSNASVLDKKGERQVSPNLVTFLYFLVLLCPILGYVIFGVYRKRDKSSYIYRHSVYMLTLGSILCVIYAYVACSLYYYFRAHTFEGDTLGFTF